MIFPSDRTYRKSKVKNSGFSLIELLIVLAIITILLLVALPRFGDSAAEVKRQDAYAALTQLAFEQEKFYAQNQTYTSDLANLNPNYGVSGNTMQTNERGENNYQILISQSSTDSYTLQATPIGTQTRDSISQFTLNHLNQQTRTIKDTKAVENKWQ